MMGNKWGNRIFWNIIYISALILLGVTIYFVLSPSVTNPSNDRIIRPSTPLASSEKKLDQNQVNIAGDYFSSSGERARLRKKDQGWEISYQTPEGPVSAEFSTQWDWEGDNLVAASLMKKSDGNTDFTITVRIFKYEAVSNPLITVTMSDGNLSHEMVFANQKDFFESSSEEAEEVIEEGDGE